MKKLKASQVFGDTPRMPESKPEKRCENCVNPGCGGPIERGFCGFWQGKPEKNCDNCAKLIAQLRALIGVVEPPERNCSCHISPPCHDCLEHGETREEIEAARELIAKIEEAV